MHNDSPAELTPGTSPSPASPSRRRFLAVAVAACGGVYLTPIPELWAATEDQPQLNAEVIARLQALRARDLIGRDEQTSWTVYDFTTGQRLVAINEGVPRQAASMIKPLVALAYFYAVAESKGRLRYTNGIRQLMERSIRDSSNTATNLLMHLVIRQYKGKDPQTVERVLKANAPEIFRETQIVETIPANGQTYRNKASAADYSRFLRALWANRLPYSSELKSLLSLPNRDRITDGVKSVPDRVVVYDKTGSTAQLCGDMGIIEAVGRDGGKYPYIFVGIIEKRVRAKDYGGWIRERGAVLRDVSDLVYRHLKQRHNLV